MMHHLPDDLKSALAFGRWGLCPRALPAHRNRGWCLLASAGLGVNAQDVLNACRTSGVELVRFIYCDFSGVQRGKITSVDDLANRLSHGINLTRAQMAFTLLDTVVNIHGMEPVDELRMLPDPDTFTVLPWMP